MSSNSVSIKAGFFNSQGGDRKYDAIDFSRIFDGLINDGVYEGYGDHFNVVSANSGLTVKVLSGRAWFNHVWAFSDSERTLQLDAADNVNPRIDVIAIRIDANGRSSSLKVVKGTANANPSFPTLTNNSNVHEYALAKILVKKNVTSITDEDITNLVGVDDPNNYHYAPYVTIPALNNEVYTQISNAIDEYLHSEELNPDALIDRIESRKVFNSYFYSEGQAESVSANYKDFCTIPDKNVTKILVVDNSSHPSTLLGYYPEIDRTFNLGDLLFGSSGKAAMVISKPSIISIPISSGGGGRAATMSIRGIVVRGLGTFIDRLTNSFANKFVSYSDEDDTPPVEKQAAARHNINADIGYIDLTEQYSETDEYEDEYAYLAAQDEGKFIIKRDDGIYYVQNDLAGDHKISRLFGLTSDGDCSFKVYCDEQESFSMRVDSEEVYCSSLKVPQPEEPDDVVNLSFLNECLNMIAEEYSNDSTYIVGDYCRHEGALYRCVYPINTPENWNPVHWTACSITDFFSIAETRSLVFANYDFGVSSSGYEGSTQYNSVPLTAFYPAVKVGDFALGRNGVLAYVWQVTENYAMCNYGTYRKTDCQSVSYSVLKNMRNNGFLIPGMQYRITDYECTVANDEEARAVSHPFDIIVTADGPGTLNENARACLHDGDDYYSADNCKSNLSSWELKYSLDNDTTRFGWAIDDRDDVEQLPVVPGVTHYEVGELGRIRGRIYRCIESYTAPNGTYSVPMDKWELTEYGTGKGVIYWMKDDWGNECPYDFKQIQFKRYPIDCQEGWLDKHMCALNAIYKIEHNMLHQAQVATDSPIWCYTFSCYIVADDEIVDASVRQYGMFDDEGWLQHCYKNRIQFLVSTNLEGSAYIRWLNNIVFYCIYDEESPEYYGCHSNTFGAGCGSNTFGRDCSSNTFGSGCQNNTFGSNCYSNTFGNYCSYNMFGSDCSYNTFGSGCQNNTFDDGCNANTFGNGISSMAMSSYCRLNTIDDGISYVSLVNESGGRNNNCIQYYHILNGTHGTNASRIVINAVRNLEYCTYIGKNSQGTLRDFVLADLVP